MDIIEKYNKTAEEYVKSRIGTEDKTELEKLKAAPANNLPIHHTPTSAQPGLRPRSLSQRIYRYASVGHCGRARAETNVGMGSVGRLFAGSA